MPLREPGVVVVRESSRREEGANLAESMELRRGEKQTWANELVRQLDGDKSVSLLVSIGLITISSSEQLFYYVSKCTRTLKEDTVR